tara:strand:- start:340 stop:642 length:303 start_codon:yes stop_codon:yes gene_type:complete
MKLTTKINKMKNLNLTQLEETILTELIDNLYAEPGFSDVSPQNLSKNTGISMKSIRGVLASLVKKDIIFLGDNDCQGMDFCMIVYLNDNYYNLHPEWKDY